MEDGDLSAKVVKLGKSATQSGNGVKLTPVEMCYFYFEGHFT